MTLSISYRSLNSLKNYDNNTRLHSIEQVDKIAASISEFGFTNPLLIDNDGVLIAGHARLLAATKLGLEQVPCVELGHLSPEQRRAYVIADNRLALDADWDFDKLALEFAALTDAGFNIDLLGFDPGELDKLIIDSDIDVPGLTDMDSVPETSERTISQRGEVWLLGSHRLMCGDATEASDIKTLMAGSIADMVFTDPPYNVKIRNLGSATTFDKASGKNIKATQGISQMHGEFKMASGEMSSVEFTDFLATCFAQLIAHSKDGSIHYICMDWRHIHELTSAGQQFTELKNVCVWNKDNGGMGCFYRSKHELVFVYKNGTAAHTNNFMLGETGRYRTNVWDYPSVSSFANENRGESKLHPTVKPTQMVIDALLDCSHVGEVILDLFGGSGTTLIACEKTQRINRSMELDEKYCDVIIKRWQDFTGKQAIRENDGQLFDDLSNG